MHCKFCGAELLEGSTYCIQCGHKNEAADQQDPTASDSGETQGETREENTGTIPPRAPGEPDLRPPKGKGISPREKKMIAGILAVAVVLVVLAVAAILPPVPKPSLRAGQYGECTEITFSVSDTLRIGYEASIYVSENGSTFDWYDGSGYFLNQNRTYTFQVYAINGLGLKSATKEYVYEMDVPKPAPLTVSVEPGRYTEPKTLEITSPDGSAIYYTMDGSEPTTQSQPYTESISLPNGNISIKAVAVNSDGTLGDVNQWDYVMEVPVPREVTFSTEEGRYTNDFELTLQSDEGEPIYYTTDGSQPDQNSAVYEGPIPVTMGTTVTISAVAVNQYGMQSPVVSKTYSVTGNRFGDQSGTVAFLKGKYYYIADRSIVQIDEEKNKTILVDNVSAGQLDTDGSYLYFNSDMNLYKIDPETKDKQLLVDQYNVFAFKVLGNRICFMATGNNVNPTTEYIWLADTDGHMIETDWCGTMNGSVAGKWDNRIYLKDYQNGQILTLTEGSDALTVLPVEDYQKDLYFWQGNYQYSFWNGTLTQTDPASGAQTILLTEDVSSETVDPGFELLHFQDKTLQTTTSYWDYQVCGNALYVRRNVRVDLLTYSVITHETTTTRQQESNVWMAVDLTTGQVFQTPCTTQEIRVADHMLIDENGQMYTSPL